MTTNLLRQTRFVRASLAALVLVLVPAVASAQARRGGGGGGPGHLEIGGELGLTIPFDSGPGVGFKLAPEGFYFLPEFSPGLSLGVGGQLAFDLHPFPDAGTFWMMDIVPMGRLRYAINPKMAVYGELGMGIGVLHFSGVSTPFGTFGGGTDSSFLMKLGGGLQFKVNEKMSFTAGPCFNFYIKSGGTTVLSLMGGLLYRV